MPTADESAPGDVGELVGEYGDQWGVTPDRRTTPLSEDSDTGRDLLWFISEVGDPAVPFECLAIDGVLSAIGTKYAHRYPPQLMHMF